MSVLAEHQGDWTWEELAALPDDGRFYEVVDGALLVMSGPRPKHGGVVALLSVLLLPSARSAGLALSAGCSTRYGATVRVPDLVVVPPDVLDRDEPAEPEDVRLVVEVESPSSRRNDRVAKMQEYAEVGIEHYWRVLPEQGPLVAVHRLEGDVYRLVKERRGAEVLAVDEPFPVSFRPADLLPPPS